MTRQTRLETDAARTKGLGYALRQLDETSGKGVLIDAGSRFVSETESRYAMVELELLAATWAVAKCRQYLLGLRHFDLWVDHQPLKSILDWQTLDCVENPRLQRLKAGLAPYTFTTTWVKGKDHAVPDALSRNPVADPTEEDLEDERDLYGSVATVIATALRAITRADALGAVSADGQGDEAKVFAVTAAFDVPGDALLADLRRTGRDDARYCAILAAVQTGGPLPKDLEKVRDHLWVQDGLVIHGLRVLPPEGARRDILQRLHAAHLGTERTLRLARLSVFWPGLPSDVRNLTSSCQQCALLRPPLPREPLQRDPMPSEAFQELACDFAEVAAKHFLVVVDRYSGYPFCCPVAGYPTAEKTVDALREIFGQFGAPQRLFSDGGTQFTAAAFLDFLRHWGVQPRVSSPAYAQSNGLAEAAVKQVKYLLTKCAGRASSSSFTEGLLAYRATPRDGGLSPAQLVFGRTPRTRVPQLAEARLPKVSVEQHVGKTAKLAEAAKQRYDASARDLTPLDKGKRVYVQSETDDRWRKRGTIVQIGKKRDYVVQMDDGGTVRQNRRKLRLATEVEGLDQLHTRSSSSSPSTSSPAPNKSAAPSRATSKAASSSTKKKKKTSTSSAQAPRRSKRVSFRPDSYRE